MYLGLFEGDSRVGVDAEDEAGSQIGNGEREAVLAVLEAELAFVVGGPDVVRLLGDGLWAAGVGAAVAAPGPDQAMSCEDASGGGDAGEVGLGVALVEEVEQDGGAPAWVSQAKVDDVLDDGGIRVRRGVVGPAGELVVAAQAGLLEAIDPLVGSPA